MKFRLIVTLAIYLLFSFDAESRIVVISDIDDTIKAANSEGKLGKVYHFLRKKIYPHTRDIFVELEKHYKDSGEAIEFHYVSAAPDFLFNQEKWLSKYDFPVGDTFLRDLGSPDTYAFKYMTMAQILKPYIKDPDLKVFFFGDNSELDPVVYDNLRKNFFLDAEIFIRDVSTEATDLHPDLEVKKLEGVHYFFSEVELLDNSALDFLSEPLRERIYNKYTKDDIIPDYTWGTLYKRIKKQKKCHVLKLKCKKKARKMTKAVWGDYHSRF